MLNFCSNCGQKIENTNFCSNCGTELKHIDDQLSRPVPPNPIQSNTYYSTQGNSQVFLSSLFVDKDERYISTFGNEQYIQFLNKGKAKKAFIVLSDKRLYIRGVRYETDGKRSINSDERGKQVKTEKIVDMKDVKTVEIGRVGRVRSFLYMYSALIVTILAIAAFVIRMLISADIDHDPNFVSLVSMFTFIAIGLSAIAVLLWVAFASSIKSCISLLCNGNWIRFPLDKYVEREGYALMKEIIIMQMPYRHTVSTPDSNYNNSISTKDGQLIVKNKKIIPKQHKGEKKVDLNEITDMIVFRRSRRAIPIIVTILFVSFFAIAIITNKPIPLFIAILIIILYLVLPAKLLQVKVICNNKWFAFPVGSRQEGSEIIRYIVEQKAYIEQGVNIESLDVYEAGRN